MNTPGIAVAEFISASTAGIVYVELGFIPDVVLLIQDHGGTNPNIWIWANVNRFPGWAAALSLLITGSTGVITRDTTGITVYAGGQVIGVVETANTVSGTVDGVAAVLGKHVHQLATGGTTFAAAGRVTAEGVAVPIDHQTNSGRNLLVAFRADM